MLLTTQGEWGWWMDWFVGEELEIMLGIAAVILMFIIWAMLQIVSEGELKMKNKDNEKETK